MLVSTNEKKRKMFIKNLKMKHNLSMIVFIYLLYLRSSWLHKETNHGDESFTSTAVVFFPPTF